MASPVKARGGGYGLDAELAKKAAMKYDYDLEREAREWIEEITGLKICDDFGPGLRDGVILCELVNKIHPNIVRRIEKKSKMPFRLMENVSNFLKACRVMGVNEFDLFETVDLFELKDLGIVVRCIHALGRAVQKNYPSFNGPALGVKESSRNERNFTEDQLAQARNAVSMISLGSSRTMERIDSGVDSVTFGATATQPTPPKRAPPPPPPPAPVQVEKPQSPPPAPPAQAADFIAKPVMAPPPVPSAVPPAEVEKPQSPPPTPPTVQESGFVKLSESTSDSYQQHVQPATEAPTAAAVTQSLSVRCDKVDSPPTSSSSFDKLEAQNEAQEWIEAVLGEKFPSEFGESLKSGVLLCRLINAIKPGLIKKIETSKMPFKQMENITAFIKACRAIGVAEFDLFETVDLFDLKNIEIVVKCLHALGRTLQKNVPEYQGPTLGVKESTSNKRSFSPEQLRQAANAIPMLQQTSIRHHLGYDCSTSVTFGADASGPMSSSSSTQEQPQSPSPEDVTAPPSTQPTVAPPAPPPAPPTAETPTDRSSASSNDSPAAQMFRKSSTKGLPTRTIWSM